MRIPVTVVAVWLDSKWTQDHEHGPMDTFQSIAQADEFLESQVILRHWMFEVHWEDGTEQKGRLSGNLRLVSQWLETWANRMISGPAEAPDDERKAFVEQTLALQPKLVQHAHKLLNQLQIK